MASKTWALWPWGASLHAVAMMMHIWPLSDQGPQSCHTVPGRSQLNEPHGSEAGGILGSPGDRAWGHMHVHTQPGPYSFLVHLLLCKAPRKAELIPHAWSPATFRGSEIRCLVIAQNSAEFEPGPAQGRGPGPVDPSWVTIWTVMVLRGKGSADSEQPEFKPRRLVPSQ